MATLGTGSFENDDAADWLDGFESDGVSAIKTALEAALEGGVGAYIEAREATHALAAAECVAAAVDGDVSRLPDEASQVLEEHQDDIVAAGLARDALRAVQRIVRKSELSEFWEEHENAEEWEESMQELMERLRV